MTHKPTTAEKPASDIDVTANTASEGAMELTAEQEKLVKEWTDAFGEKFALWSELGWWMKKYSEAHALGVTEGREKERQSLIDRMFVAMTEQRVLDCQQFGANCYAPITRQDAINALTPPQEEHENS